MDPDLDSGRQKSSFSFLFSEIIKSCLLSARFSIYFFLGTSFFFGKKQKKTKILLVGTGFFSSSQVLNSIKL